MNEKKTTYLAAEIEVLRFSSEDIVTASDLTHVDPDSGSWD